MDAKSNADSTRNTVKLERRGREVIITRTVNGPAHLVFQAWTQPELFKRWWVPKSIGMTMLSCEMDVRAGGGYKLVFSHPDFPEPMPFFGKYLEVTPPIRLVWTNEEGADGEQVTTVTFEEKDGKTLVTVSELYPSKEALDEAIASGSTSGDMSETFDQLDELLATLG